MRLRELCVKMPGCRIVGAGDPEIVSAVCDSRHAERGALFAALPGSKADGRQFAAAAVAAGAAAVLAGEELGGLGVPAVVAPEPRKAFAEAACALAGDPTLRLKLIGVTGTNGKSTVTFLLAHILRALGFKTGMLGTIVYDTCARQTVSSLTTPDAAQFTAYLREMAEAGAQYAVVEASSHALSQWRVWPHRFCCAVFTNLTRDHLDYHASMGEYLESKKRLFDWLDPTAWAVVNQDDPAGALLLENCAGRVCRYGLSGGADLTAEIRESGVSGQRLEVSGGEWAHEFFVPLAGRYNAQNCLAALAAAYRLGLDFERAAAAISSFPGVPGRLERIEGAEERAAFVDYAHTDDALRSALGALRPLARGRLLVLFGCGGDRDRGKRPLMARAAEELADLVFVSSDNPRTEEPRAIIADIMKGFSRPQAVRVEPEREAAVRLAVAELRPNDVLLIAGKGHEDYQIIGTEKRHLDDRELARKAMESQGWR